MIFFSRAARPACGRLPPGPVVTRRPKGKIALSPKQTTPSGKAPKPAIDFRVNEASEPLAGEVEEDEIAERMLPNMELTMTVMSRRRKKRSVPTSPTAAFAQLNRKP